MSDTKTATQQAIPMVEIPARDLLTVMPFRADDAVRYCMSGISIEPIDGGCMLVATNGHVLAAMKSKGTRCDKLRVLNVDRAFERALRVHGGLGVEKYVRVLDENSRTTLMSSVNEYYIHPGKAFIDDKFPDWRRVLAPRESLKRGLPAMIAAEYVAKLQRALPPMQRGHGVQFWYDEREPKKNAIVARYHDLPELVVLIMPLREEGELAFPDWYPRGAPAGQTEAA